MTEELLGLGLLKPSDVKSQTSAAPACKKYFRHGVGHSLGLDVHDVTLSKSSFAPGWGSGHRASDLYRRGRLRHPLRE